MQPNSFGRMREMKVIVLLGCALVVCMNSGAQSQEGKPRTTAEGVFTQEQAKSGEDTYQAQCAGCHGVDLHSTDSEAPDLTDGSFKFGWVGKTIAEMFGTRSEEHTSELQSRFGISY